MKCSITYDFFKMKNGIYDFCDKADFLMILKGNSGHLRTSDFSKTSSYLFFFSRCARLQTIRTSIILFVSDSLSGEKKKRILKVPGALKNRHPKGGEKNRMLAKSPKNNTGAFTNGICRRFDRLDLSE